MGVCCTVMLKAWETDVMTFEPDAVKLAAVTVPLKVPGVVGVPVNTPELESVRPGGRLPEVTEKVGMG